MKINIHKPTTAQLIPLIQAGPSYTDTSGPDLILDFEMVKLFKKVANKKGDKVLVFSSTAPKKDVACMQIDYNKDEDKYVYNGKELHVVNKDGTFIVPHKFYSYLLSTPTQWVYLKTN